MRLERGYLVRKQTDRDAWFTKFKGQEYESNWYALVKPDGKVTSYEVDGDPYKPGGTRDKMVAKYYPN